MRNASLQTQLGAVFTGFLLLVLCSVTVTFWLMQAQHNDAAIINLAGRQRMLTQQMIHLALTDPANPELNASINQFEQTLTALMQGGEVVDSKGRSTILSSTSNPAIRAQLEEIIINWPIFYQQLQSPIDSMRLQADFSNLLAKLDAVVTAYETEAQAKINRLRWVQIIFLGAAFLLLALGYRIIHGFLIRPLALLGISAQEIGAGRLGEPIPMPRGMEFGQLAQTMETMRVEIAASQILLEQKVMQRTQELTAAFEFSQEIVREMEPAHLLQSVANHTRDLMQGEASAVCVLEGNGRTLKLTAGSGHAQNHLGLRQSTERGLALPVIHEHKTMIAQGACTNCGFLHRFPDTSCIAAPLQIGGRSLGALCVVRSQSSFTTDEARSLTLLANAAAVALENARLIEAGKQQAQENASLAEREQLAAELHDNLAQTLGALRLSSDMLADDISAGQRDAAQLRIKEMQANLSRAYTQVRMVLTGLSEAETDNSEFIAALHVLLAEFEAQTGLSCKLDMDEGVEIALTAVVQKQALHIIREALNNTRRHAQASHVLLSISRNDDTVTFDISDDGIGFDPHQVNGQNHLGLAIMRTRAERSHGKLTIHSLPQQGTHVTFTFPIKSTPKPYLESA